MKKLLLLGLGTYFMKNHKNMHEKMHYNFIKNALKYAQKKLYTLKYAILFHKVIVFDTVYVVLP